MSSTIPDEIKEQYGRPDRLKSRMSLHAKYGRPDWFPWLAAHMNLHAGSTVADVGCGMGELWSEVADCLLSGVTLHLVDQSAAMVEAATARLAGRDSIDARGTVADAMVLPFEAGSFDTSLAIHMLYHLPDLEQGVRELRRTVKVGGLVLAALNGTRNMRQLAELTASVFGGPGRDPSTLLFSAERGEDVFRAHFPHVAVERFEDELLCTDPVDVLAYIQSLPIPSPALE